MRRPFVYPARNLVQFLRAIQPVVLERTLHVLSMASMMSWCTSFSFWMPTQRPPWPAQQQLNRIGAHAGSGGCGRKEPGTAALNVAEDGGAEFHGQSLSPM